jgi:hypothetical protein
VLASNVLPTSRSGNRDELVVDDLLRLIVEPDHEMSLKGCREAAKGRHARGMLPALDPAAAPKPAGR